MANHPSRVTRIRLEHFTGFDALDLRPSPGINVLVGANGTGKTHLMKVAYAACDATRTTGGRFADKLVRVFMPAEGRIGRLVKRRQGVFQAQVEVRLGAGAISASFHSRSKSPESATVHRSNGSGMEVRSVYIPVKEMLANAPGFHSLYAERSIHFEEIYRDVLDRAYLPPLHDASDVQRRILEKLRRVMKGTVELKNEEFFLVAARGRTGIEFTLLAEGLRKFGLLWLLVRNGTLLEGSVLFWDEPETNLNPKLFGPVVEVLLELQRLGVQIFIATHDYVILKQLDLQATGEDEIAYHALSHDSHDNGAGGLVCSTTDAYLGIDPNMIAEAFTEIYDLEIRRSLGEGR